ncbi:MAG TPA: cytochrome c-type biogenesis protein CcmH [Abditibacteriaceae bacterium]|jgi:cytochrome c-type biogenesis protein CcmH/NrfF
MKKLLWMSALMLSLAMPRVSAQPEASIEADTPTTQGPRTKVEEPRPGALKASPSSETALQPSVMEVARQIVCQCPDCGKQTVDQCAPGCAEGQQHRKTIEDQIAQGKTAVEIVNYFGDTQGEYMLATPRATGFGIAAYMLPALFVMLSLVPLGLVLRSRRKEHIVVDGATLCDNVAERTSTQKPPADDPRVAAALRDYDF